MSDNYTYLLPADPAEDAAGDMEYTYDAPPVRLVRASEVAELQARLAAANARAWKAELTTAEWKAEWAERCRQLDAMRQHLAAANARAEAAEAKLAAAQGEVQS